MKCREALNLLYDYLDSQLEDQKIEEIHEHLKNCKNCCDTYHFEERLNLLIRQRGREESSGIVENLKNRVRSCIEDLPANNGQKEGPPRFFLFRPGYAFAAMAAVIVIALVFYVSNSNRLLQAGTLKPFVENHEMAIAGLLEMDINTTDPHIIDSCLSSMMTLPKHVFIKDNDCHPEMGKILRDGDHSYAQIVYKVHDKDVSVFVARIEDMPKLDKLAKSLDKSEIYTYNMNSHSLFLWHCKDYWYIATGQIDEERFDNFISHINNN